MQGVTDFENATKAARKAEAGFYASAALTLWFAASSVGSFSTAINWDREAEYTNLPRVAQAHCLSEAVQRSYEFNTQAEFSSEELILAETRMTGQQLVGCADRKQAEAQELRGKLMNAFMINLSLFVGSALGGSLLLTRAQKKREVVSAQEPDIRALARSYGVKGVDGP